MIYKWLNIKHLNLFPKSCLLCLASTPNRHLLCSACENDLPSNPFHCIICSSPLPHQTDEKSLVCGVCQQYPPTYTTSLIPHLYASPLKQLITQLKFHANLSYAPLLVHKLVDLVKQRRKLPDCIIPVPLHKQRLRERGFNQALELARIVAVNLNIPLDYSICQRTKSTPFQSGLSAKQRKQNLRNAFSVTKEHSYKHVAIFDDVVTTGMTVNELAKQLKLSGVETVEVWAIARTVDKKI